MTAVRTAPVIDARISVLERGGPEEFIQDIAVQHRAKGSRVITRIEGVVSKAAQRAQDTAVNEGADLILLLTRTRSAVSAKCYQRHRRNTIGNPAHVSLQAGPDPDRRPPGLCLKPVS